MMLYLKACRACLATECKLIKINEKTKKVFSDTTGLQINPGDGMPQYFCAECSAYIKKSMVFRKRSRRAHFVLKEIISVKKQINQDDVLSIDRTKTNLMSTVGYWNPQKNVCYYYSTSDAQVKTETAVSSELDCMDGLGVDNAVPWNQDNYQTTTSPRNTENTEQTSQSNILNYTIDRSELKPLIRIYPEESYNIKELRPSTAPALQHEDIVLLAHTTERENKVHCDFLKEEANVLNTSAIVTDIKPDNCKEIEREAEKQREIELALEEIWEENNNDDNDYNLECDNIDDPAPDIVHGDIDMEDIFKGLPVDEVDSDFEWTKSYDEDNEQLLLPRSKNKQIVKALAACSIRYLSLEEQAAVYRQQLLKDPFKSAVYKCVICVVTFPNIEAIRQHFTEHNNKLSFTHVCQVCKRRFEDEEEWHAHCANTHWYEYTCGAGAGGCPHTHHSLTELSNCWAKHAKTEFTSAKKIHEKLKTMFKIQLLKPQMFGLSLKLWTNRSGRVVGEPAGRLNCGRCRIVFASSMTHRRHMEQHETHGSRPLVCDVCGLTFARKTQGHRGLTFHIRSRHMFTYRCKMCQCKLYNRSQALYHLHNCPDHSVAPKESQPTEARIYCNMCAFYTTAGLPKLYDHQLFKHGYFRMPTEPSLHEPGLECVQCQRFFCKRSYLNLHYIKEGHAPPGALDLVCLVCGESFENATALGEHTAGNHPAAAEDALKCTTCDEIFVNTWSRNKHMREKHPNSEKYKLCEICGKVYKQHSLVKHMSFHKSNAELYTYRCQFCGHLNYSAQPYVIHVLFNHTLKPYCCTICGQRFHGRCDVRDHILKNHAPCRPYECAPCERRFSHLDYLHEHCLKAHELNLKKTDKSVYHATHLRKIFVYEHVKIDGSLIDENILASVNVERCDYMEQVFEPVDYKDAFFFDPTDLFSQFDIVDPSRHYHRPLAIRVDPWLRRGLFNPFHPEDGDLTENLSRAHSPEAEADIHYRGELSMEGGQNKTGQEQRVNGKLFKVVTNKSEYYYSDN